MCEPYVAGLCGVYVGAQSCGCVSALEWESARSGVADIFDIYLTMG